MSEPRLPDLARSFERHLRAENKSDRTVETYLEAVRLLQADLARRGVGLAEADRAHIEAFLPDLLARWKPATAANRYRSLKVFYAWLEDEGEITADPMAKMKPPAIPEQPIPVVPDEALRRPSKSRQWVLTALRAGGDFQTVKQLGDRLAQAGHPLKPCTIQLALGELDAAGLAQGSEEGSGRARYWSPAPPDDAGGNDDGGGEATSALKAGPAGGRLGADLADGDASDPDESSAPRRPPP